MARLLRLAFPGAVYHLTARGNARQDIYLDDMKEGKKGAPDWQDNCGAQH